MATQHIIPPQFTSHHAGQGIQPQQFFVQLNPETEVQPGGNELDVEEGACLKYGLATEVVVLEVQHWPLIRLLPLS